MLRWRLRPLLLLALTRTSLAEPATEDCIVRGKLEFEGKSLDSVSFSALAHPNNTFFKAVVTCENRTILYDTLTFSKDSVEQKRAREFGNPTGKEIKAPKTGFGWTEFSLVTESQSYRFEDSKGQIWISEEDTRGCKVKKVKIEEGVLMAGCLGGAPTWQVSGGCTTLPIAQPGPEWNLQMTLSSTVNFTPSFNIGGHSFVLGLVDDAPAVLAIGASVDALAPERAVRLCLALSIEKRISLKVVVDGRVDQTVTLKSAPAAFQVCGNNGNFTMKLPGTTNDCGPKEEVLREKLPLLIGSTVGVVAVVGLLVGFLCCYKNRVSRNVRRSSRGNSASKNNAPSKGASVQSAIYLEPIPVPSCSAVVLPPAGDWQAGVLFNNRRSSSPDLSSTSEHIYEEMNESEVTNEHSYENIHHECSGKE